ncbi:MAG: hypothetical protein U1F57_03545 [bacterium]
MGRLGSIILGGDPKRVDPGIETVMVAALFNSSVKGSYPNLLPFRIRITTEDIDLYSVETNRGVWRKKREEIKSGFQLSKVNHPFAQVVDAVEVERMDRFRGLPAFDRLADVVSNQLPRVKTSRDLKVLYPGGGSHVAPLMTALKLIDQGHIDQATFTYTELEKTHYGVLDVILSYGVSKGVFDKITAEKWAEFPGEGAERSLEISYKGRPVRILFAVKRSGENYYRDEYLKAADLVILHDPGIGYLSDSFDLLADILLKNKTLALPQNQLLVMEGERKTKADEKIAFPSGMAQQTLPGPYGHCRGVDWVGEVNECDYESARVFLLNDPALRAMSAKYTDRIKLSGALYEDLEPRVYISK